MQFHDRVDAAIALHKSESHVQSLKRSLRGTTQTFCYEDNVGRFGEEAEGLPMCHCATVHAALATTCDS